MALSCPQVDGECSRQQHCPAGYYCAMCVGVCLRRRGPGLRCADNRDCLPDLRCIPRTWTCGTDENDPRLVPGGASPKVMSMHALFVRPALEADATGTRWGEMGAVWDATVPGVVAALLLSAALLLVRVFVRRFSHPVRTCS